MDPGVCGQESLQFTIANDVPEISALRAAADGFAVGVGFTATRRLDLQLVLEEAVSNVIRHAWDRGRHTFEVRLARVGAGIVAEVDDDGRPFDPLGHPPLDPDAPLERRRGGGMGIYLIHRLTDGLIYERHGGRNRLRMTLHPRPADEPTAS
jgi:serine/threonine-protein kinase RsbW